MVHESISTHTQTHNHFRTLFQDHPGKPVPEENLLLDFYGAREDSNCLCLLKLLVVGK